MRRLRVCGEIEVQFPFKIQSVPRKQSDCCLTELAVVTDVDNDVSV